MDISIIIVSYNVKYLLAGLLHSLQQALQQKISYEIIVVDNNSTDNTPEYISGKALNLTIIKNKENLGFAAANNQGIAVAKGKYILLINPDTLVEEDIFEKLIAFLEKHPQYGGVTAKMLNPDGSFAIDCRHGIPSPRDAFYKAMGMTKIFPNSKHFSYYNQTFLEENDENDIPAFSGAFMLLREKTVNEVGLLDDSFFMYCEDIDYCCRLNKKKWRIRYLPTVRLLHFKGESTKEKNYDYFKNFNLSMLHFFKKHHATKYPGLFSSIVKFGVFLRGFLMVIKENFTNKKNSSEKHSRNLLFLKKTNDAILPDSTGIFTLNISDTKNEIDEIEAAIKKDSISKIIFNVSIGYNTIFNIMENLSYLKIDFAFY
ncbi:MAG: glycosyltransferase family 2 protein, partial [Calditrichia bacterium]|nr:glycosyltransferase family 2 protein [Calditrichia bacterium]